MCTGRLSQACPWGHGLYSSVVERQSCKLKVLGSIPSEGSFELVAVHAAGALLHM